MVVLCMLAWLSMAPAQAGEQQFNDLRVGMPVLDSELTGVRVEVSAWSVDIGDEGEVSEKPSLLPGFELGLAVALVGGWDLRLSGGPTLAGRHWAVGVLGGIGTDRMKYGDVGVRSAFYGQIGLKAAALTGKRLGAGGSARLLVRSAATSTQELRAEGWISVLNLRAGVDRHIYYEDVLRRFPPSSGLWVFWVGAGLPDPNWR